MGKSTGSSSSINHTGKIKREKTASEVVFKAILDATARLASAGVDFYIVVARNGYTTDDGKMSAENASAVIQRLDAIKEQYARTFPRE
jgi:hypothetical protein